jgi:hypothetical protein
MIAALIALAVAAVALAGAGLDEGIRYLTHHRLDVALTVIVAAGTTAHWFVRLFKNQGKRVAPKAKRKGVPA